MNQVQIIPLGGAGEIGKNCTVVSQGDDLIVVDAGLSFPNEEMPGVDIVIPDFTYLIENRHRIRGVFLTHAHEDHVGALPYLLRMLQVPVYATPFTTAMIRSKLEEKVEAKRIDLRPMKPGDKIECGCLTVEPVRVTHSIPETCAMAVHTSHGVVLFTADFKFDFTPVDGKLTDMDRLAELGREGVVCLLSDSTNIERPGWGPSERSVREGLYKAFVEAPGRILITTFASTIHRMQQALDVAAETGRKVAVAGRRMEQNIDTCTRLGYMTIPKGTFIRLDEIKNYAPNQLVILTTGSQGEPMSALVQMSKETYSRLRILPGDTILYCARPIPGNEAAIWRTVNRLFRMGATVIYDASTPIHVSGHAYQEELKMMINLTRPYYLAPVHGEPRHQHLYSQMARNMGYPEHRVFDIQDGDILAIDDTQAEISGRVHSGRVLVDNGGNTGITDDVLRDRNTLASDGLIMVTLAVDLEAGEIVGDTNLQAKGFSGDEGALAYAGKQLDEALSQLSKVDIQDVDKVRHTVTDSVRRSIHRRASLRPLIMPTVIEV